MKLADRLARNIRVLRGHQTQTAFARRLGISQATLARLENGAQNTTLSTLEQITKALRCDVGELFKSPSGK